MKWLVKSGVKIARLRLISSTINISRVELTNILCILFTRLLKVTPEEIVDVNFFNRFVMIPVTRKLKVLFFVAWWLGQFTKSYLHFNLNPFDFLIK